MKSNGNLYVKQNAPHSFTFPIALSSGILVGGTIVILPFVTPLSEAWSEVFILLGLGLGREVYLWSSGKKSIFNPDDRYLNTLQISFYLIILLAIANATVVERKSFWATMAVLWGVVIPSYLIFQYLEKRYTKKDRDI